MSIPLLECGEHLLVDFHAPPHPGHLAIGSDQKRSALEAIDFLPYMIFPRPSAYLRDLAPPGTVPILLRPPEQNGTVPLSEAVLLEFVRFDDDAAATRRRLPGRVELDRELLTNVPNNGKNGHYRRRIAQP